MSDYWTSDNHFFHRKIVQYCARSRPFDSIEEMNEHMVQEWNGKVRPEDDVYHLGDFSFGTHDKTESILKRLNGNIHMVLGNHDRLFEGDLKQYMTEVVSYKEMPARKYGVPIVMFHFPIEDWNRKNYESIHLHGHLHSSSDHHPCSLMRNRMDIGVDAHPTCAPWSWEEIHEHLSKMEVE